MKQIEFTHLVGDTKVISNLVIATPDEWANDPQSLSPLWNTRTEKGIVYSLAVETLVCPNGGIVVADSEATVDSDPDFNPVFRVSKPRKKRAS